MPIVSVFYSDEEGRSNFLGTCDYTRREELSVKLRLLCQINGWNFDALTWVHHFNNSLVGCEGKVL
jgi:hypothetical protein